MFLYTMKFKYILIIICAVALLQCVYSIRAADFTAEPIKIHDRPQVFISAPYGGVQGENWRHGMGVLIHPSFIITAGVLLKW